MAQNYVGSGRVITVSAPATITGGTPITVKGLNGVALISADSGQPCTVQLEGVFTLSLAGVTAGAAIYIDGTTGDLGLSSGTGKHFFGRALTASDGADLFQCRLQQNLD